MLYINLRKFVICLPHVQIKKHKMIFGGTCLTLYDTVCISIQKPFHTEKTVCTIFRTLYDILCLVVSNNLILYVLFHSHYTSNFSLYILFVIHNTYEYLFMKWGCYWVHIKILFGIQGDSAVFSIN